MPTLQFLLDSLAQSFAEQIVAAIRASPLQELISSESNQIGFGRTARTDAPKAFSSSSAARKHVFDATHVPALKGAHANGRLSRRSSEEIRATLNKIVLLVKTQKNGLRAEDIRAKLGMQAKELPRILKEGVATKVLSTKGQKRATTYFAK